MVTHRAFSQRSILIPNRNVLCSEIVMKIKTIKKFINFITKHKLNEDNESIARAHYMNESLDDHDFWMNRESRGK